jgi:Tfp pilus assembly protein PilW
MLTKRPHPTAPAPRDWRAALSDEGGYSLIELLVSIISGIAVCFALFSILNFSTDQTAHLTGYAQATQQGRIAMTKVVDELRSACLAPGFAPVQVGSSGTELRFINAFSEEAVISKTQVNEQRIVWNEKAETLTDYTYPTTKEITWPTFEYSSTASPVGGVRLASNVTETEAEGKKVPIFQYYSYKGESSESATIGLSTLNTKPIISGAETLTKETAPTAASVLISFNAGPSVGKTDIGALGKGINDGLQTQVTLSFSVPISNDEVVDAPCK